MTTLPPSGTLELQLEVLNSLLAGIQLQLNAAQGILALLETQAADEAPVEHPLSEIGSDGEESEDEQQSGEPDYLGGS